MEYRVNRRTGDRISVLGVGTSGLPAAGAKEGAATLEMALEQGINYFDLATADSACFPIFGAALAGVRRQVLYQVHFGANYAAGKPYSWTTDLETVKRSTTASSTVWTSPATGAGMWTTAFFSIWRR